ncbi:HEAT repeat domain-containing protein [Pseudomonas sp. CGJS7]|uniref:HEAT repeat domain-containing protein n=1 Tax=Pseudomonas sp. CGJS7 TaxID=3109348 RepID=UPI00300A3418
MRQRVGDTGHPMDRSPNAPVRPTGHPLRCATAALIAAVAFGCGWFASTWFSAGDRLAQTHSAAPPLPAERRTLEDPKAGDGYPQTQREGQAAGIAPAGEPSRPALLAALNCSDSAQKAISQRCFDELARFPLSDPQIRDTFLAYLAATPDPSRREQVIAAMTPTPLSTEQLAPLLVQLQSLRESDDPRIRASGLVHLAQWDRSAAIEKPLREGLDDSAPEVVRSAITAVSLSNARGDELKQTLLLLASESPPGSELRDAAVTALRDFSLNAREFAIYQDAAGADRAASTQ